MNGTPVHRFVVVVQADVEHVNSAAASDWLRNQLEEIAMDPSDRVDVVSITEVTR